MNKIKKTIATYFLKKAAKIFDLTTSPDYEERASRTCHVSPPVQRPNQPTNLPVFDFKVVCKVHTHEVTVAFAIPHTETKDLVAIDNLEVKVLCSCPAFRFQGVSYNANMGNYLLDEGFEPWIHLYPKVRDPKLEHNLCKHIAAVRNYLKRSKLQISYS